MNRGCLIAVIIGLIIFCCCVTTGIGVALIGNFTLNDECIWKGPFVSDLNPECSIRRDAENLSNRGGSSVLNLLEDENNQVEEEEVATEKTDPNSLIFSNKVLSFRYPNNTLFVLSDVSTPTQFDLTITALSDKSTLAQTLRMTELATSFEANNSNCKIYMDSFIQSVEGLFGSELSNETYSVVRVDGVSACKINYDRVDIETNLEYSQTLYTIPVIGLSYNFITVYNPADSVNEVFEKIISSVRFN